MKTNEKYYIFPRDKGIEFAKGHNLYGNCKECGAPLEKWACHYGQGCVCMVNHETNCFECNPDPERFD